MLALNNNLLDHIKTELTKQYYALNNKCALLHCKVEIKGLTPLQFLKCASLTDCMYLEDRAGTFSSAGIGSAVCFSSDNYIDFTNDMQKMQVILQNTCADLRFYGGLAFDINRPVSNSWSQFGVYRFHIPRFECRSTSNNRVSLMVTIADTPDYKAEIDAAVQDLKGIFAEAEHNTDQGLSADHIQVHKRTYSPDQQNWIKTASDIIDMYDQDLTKVVLACKETLHLSKSVNAVDLFQGIMSRGPAYKFFFSYNGSVFMGASPECLYQRDGSKLFTEALAGTCAGDDIDLLRSDKDNLEHDYVVRDMHEALKSICTKVFQSEPKELLVWQNLTHLRSKFQGDIAENIMDMHILAALHPSAAVLGYSRNTAWSVLREYEPFDRGWYAGPVGYIGKNTSMFAVAIRSALVYGKTLELFAGAGIVRGSDVQNEFNEVCSKMQQYHETLGI